MDTEELKKQAADAAEGVKNTAEDLMKKAEEAIEEFTQSDAVKAVREKVENAVEQLTSSETAQQAQAFVSEQAERAGEFLKETAENLGNSDIFKKLKDIAGIE